MAVGGYRLLATAFLAVASASSPVSPRQRTGRSGWIRSEISNEISDKGEGVNSLAMGELLPAISRQHRCFATDNPLSVLKIGPFKPGGSRGHLGGLPPYPRRVGASMFLLAHDAYGLYFLFYEARGLPFCRFNLAPLPGLPDVSLRLNLVPGLPQIGRGYLGNGHLAGHLVLEGIRVEMQYVLRCSRWAGRWSLTIPLRSERRLWRGHPTPHLLHPAATWPAFVSSHASLIRRRSRPFAYSSPLYWRTVMYSRSTLLIRLW